MKNVLLITFVLFSVFGCQNNRNEKSQDINRDNLTQKEIDSVLDKINFTYHHPVVIDSSDIIMIPIGTEIQRGKIKYRYDSESYDKYNYSKYWNFTFNNTATQTTNLLTTKKSYITDYLANKKEVGKVASSSIFYEIADIDYNNDDLLNYEDPQHLFISNNDGSNLIRLSPKNEDLLNWTIIAHTDQVIINTKRDTNNDSKFDHKDAEIFYLLDLKTPEIISEIINSENRNTIEQLYFDSWLSTKTTK